MKRRLWAVMLATLTLTACAELESSLERVKSWGEKSEGEKSEGEKSRGEAEAKPESSAAKMTWRRPLAKSPRRKPNPSQRTAAKPKPAPKPNMPKPGVPKPDVAKPDAPKADVPNTDLVSIKNLGPKLLLGLDFNTTKALLGDPEVEYEQPPAKVWTYRGGTCMFSVFFFPNLKDSVFRVLTYKVTGADQATNSKKSDSRTSPGSAQDGAKKLARRCFVELLTDHATPNEG